MENHVQFPIVQPSNRFLRRNLPRQNKHRLLPDELRNRLSHRDFPKSLMASNLTHRLRCSHRRLALPLFPP